MAGEIFEKGICIFGRMREEHGDYLEMYMHTENFRKDAQEELTRMGKETTRLRAKLAKARAVNITLFLLLSVEPLVAKL